MASSESPGSSSELTSVIRTNKRRSTAVSCNECRRLKLRCSREPFPCTNCVKKGCGVICPDGSLTTGKGNRFVLANTEELHEKIETLADRVRKLEDALADTHTSLSDEPHPLLKEELLTIKRPLERSKPPPTPQADDREHEDEGRDTLASLSISGTGRAKFFGTNANSWYLFQDEEEGKTSGSAAPEFPFSSRVPSLCYASPFTTTVGEKALEVYQTIMKQLPTASVAKAIVEIYYRNAAWMYNPISEAEFDSMIFSHVYPLGLASTRDDVHPHCLAILLSILALGTLLDLQRIAHSPEANHYYQLSRSALSLKSVLEEQSVMAVRALLLVSHYMFLDNIEGTRWVTMGLAIKLAQSVGLHRDSGKWNLSPEETTMRRSLMWELYTYDSWQSLTYGRPPSFASMAHVDCQMAHDTTIDQNGVLEMSFAAWKHRFSAECLSIVHDRAFGAKMPNYKTIQDLDKKVREFYVPPSLQVPCFGGATIGMVVEQPPVHLTMQRHIAFAIREITLFYMHRGFFARAVEENSDDPLGSRFSPSVLAVYSSACSFVGLIESLFSQQAGLTERMWFLFMHVFSCSIVLGAIATKPRMTLAPSALSHLESALRLFEQVSGNPRATKILPIIRNLAERARTYATTLLPIAPTPAHPLSFASANSLSGMGGMTPYLNSMTPSSSSSSSAPSPPSQSVYSMSTPSSTSSTSYAKTPPFLQGNEPLSATSSSTSWQDFGHIQTFDNFPSNPAIGTLSPLQSGADILANFPMSMDVASNVYTDFSNLTKPQTIDDYRYDPDISWQNFVDQMQHF